MKQICVKYACVIFLFTFFTGCSENTSRNLLSLFQSREKIYLPGKQISCLFKSYDGTVLIGTSEGEVYRLANKKVKAVKSVSKINGAIYSIYEDEKCLLIGSRHNGLFSSVLDCRVPLPDSDKKENYSVYAICPANDLYLLGTSNGLFAYDSKLGMRRLESLDTNKDGRIAFTDIIRKDDTTFFLTVEGHGLWQLNLETNCLKKLELDSGNIHSLMYDQSGLLYGIRNKDIIKIDTGNGEIIDSISIYAAHTIQPDVKGYVWTITQDKVYYNWQEFRDVKIYQPPREYNTYFSNLLLVDEQAIYIGTEKGVIEWEAEGKVLVESTQLPVKKILKKTGNDSFLVLSGNKLMEIDLQNKEGTSFAYPAFTKEIRETDQFVLLGDQLFYPETNHLYSLDIKTGELKELCIPDDRSPIVLLSSDSLGNLWIGTQKSLYRYFPEEGKFTRIEEFEGINSYDLVPRFIQHSLGKWYIGTKNEGLFFSDACEEYSFERIDPRSDIKAITNKKDEIFLLTSDSLISFSGTSYSLPASYANLFTLNESQLFLWNESRLGYLSAEQPVWIEYQLGEEQLYDCFPDEDRLILATSKGLYSLYLGKIPFTASFSDLTGNGWSDWIICVICIAGSVILIGYKIRKSKKSQPVDMTCQKQNSLLTVTEEENKTKTEEIDSEINPLPTEETSQQINSSTLLLSNDKIDLPVIVFKKQDYTLECFILQILDTKKRLEKIEIKEKMRTLDNEAEKKGLERRIQRMYELLNKELNKINEDIRNEGLYFRSALEVILPLFIIKDWMPGQLYEILGKQISEQALSTRKSRLKKDVRKYVEEEKKTTPYLQKLYENLVKNTL